MRKRALRVVGPLLEHLGASGLGTPALRSLGYLARAHLVPTDAAGAMIVHLAHGSDDRSITIRRSLGGRPVRLNLDLAYSGCRELLCAPRPGAPDTITGDLLLALARDATLVVDVGANVGLYTCLTAANIPNARIVSFEPTADLARLIATNVSANGWQDRVTVRTEAVGAEAGALTFHLMRDGDTEHTLDPSRVAGRAHETIVVPVVALDDVLRSEDVDPARTVLKIDVEGHERSALDGLERTLNQSAGSPDIIMEFLGHAIENEALIERVLGHNLSLHYAGPQGLTRLESTRSLAAVHTLGFWNFLISSRTAENLDRMVTRAGLALNR